MPAFPVRCTVTLFIVCALASTVAASPIQAQSSTSNVHWVEFGVGVGAGTGFFGGPGGAITVRIGPPSSGIQLGGEFVMVVRRENYAEGGAFFPDPGRTRTLVRMASSVVARVGGPNGSFAQGGIGIGAVHGIDTSVQDAAPLTLVGTAVVSAGVGTRWPVGSVVVVPRLDTVVHIGGLTRVTGLAGVGLALF